MTPVRFRREAKVELNRAAAYYEEQRDGLGLDLLSEVEKVTQRIGQNPKLHAVYKDTPCRKAVVARFPFNVFYQELDDVVWIVAVAHAKRKPDYWIGRTGE